MSWHQKIQEAYLGQPISEFVENGGNPREYAKLVFNGEIWPGDDPRNASLGIDSEEDLAVALEQLIERWEEGRRKRLAALEEHRDPHPLNPASPTVRFDVRIPQVDLERLDATAAARGVTRSAAVRAAIEAWLEDTE